jgi:hypothetical protein
LATCSITSRIGSPSSRRSPPSRALRPGGLLALDICDLAYDQARHCSPPLGQAGEDWAVITAASRPAPDRFVRQITVFLRNADGSWRRDDERHDNVLLDTAQVPALLAAEHIEVTVTSAFGAEHLPTGLAVLIGRHIPHSE